MTTVPLLETERVSKSFHVASATLLARPRSVWAVDDVSLSLAPGETLGLVGESGSGKSTLGRLILRLVNASGGRIRWRGEDVLALSRRRFKPYRRLMQMIFQDPLASLNPRYTVAQSVEEPMVVHMTALDRRQRRERMLDLLAQVGLDRAAAARYPHEFSGGQRQRIGIARALAAEPELVVADEPVSALDVSIQAQVLNLMLDLREKYGLSYLFIAHDLAVVRHMSQRVAVMYFGKIVEVAPVRDLFARPAHPYTRMLLRSVPRMRPATAASEGDDSIGEIPSSIKPPSGCAFHDRCKYRVARCAEAAPALREIAPAHRAACHLA